VAFPQPAELRAIARGLAASAGDLGHLAAGTEREWLLVAESEAYEAWVIGWPAGGALELHDHGGSRGVVSVVSGSLVETSVARFGDRLTLRTRTISVATSPLSIGCERIHDVMNPGPAPALSVHVYSPRLTSMTFFELAYDGLRAQRTDHLGASEPAGGRRAS
jgi:predicted metal-dependent enzyme (double-stranded beta helix superfamily)